MLDWELCAGFSEGGVKEKWLAGFREREVVGRVW